jgi:hypothetical protein
MARPKMVRSGIVFKEFTLNAASIAAATSGEQTVTIAGLRKGYPVIVWGPSLEGNLGLSNAYCSAADTLVFRLVNPTVGAIDPASQSFFCVQF